MSTFSLCGQTVASATTTSSPQGEHCREYDRVWGPIGALNNPPNEDPKVILAFRLHLPREAVFLFLLSRKPSADRAGYPEKKARRLGHGFCVPCLRFFGRFGSRILHRF